MVIDCKRAEMSVGIYNNVIRTESFEINKDRVEKTVEIYESADCVRDHDFRPETKTHQPPQQIGSDSVKIRNYRAAIVCLVLLCVLLLTAVIVLCVHIYTNYTEETNQLLTKYINMTNERDGLLTKNDNLTKQRDQLSQERNQMQKILNETDGWLYSSFSFYFISSLSNSWSESRRYCTERGADLIIINNREEQDFVRRIADTTYVWIGLTDIDVEGTWKWVDGSTLTSGFWDPREPNGQNGENCALSYSPGWADYPCNAAYRWICEKSLIK